MQPGAAAEKGRNGRSEDERVRGERARERAGDRNQPQVLQNNAPEIDCTADRLRQPVRSLAHAKMPNLPSIHSPSHVNRNPSPSLPPSHRCGGGKRVAGGRGREERVRACILFISLSREARRLFQFLGCYSVCLQDDRLRPRNAVGRADGRSGRGGGVPCLLCKSNRF